MSTDSTDTIEIPPSGNEPRNAGPASVEVHVDLGAVSHVGKVRLNNEDHYLVARFDRTMQTLLTNVAEGQIPARHVDTAYGMMVADGVGGHAHGEVASRAAISSLVDLVLNQPDWIMLLDPERIREVMRRTEQRFQQVKQTLTELAQGHPSWEGMGTTLTLVCSFGLEMIIGHVGDSRAYLFRGGRLARLTRDHTAVEALISMGTIQPSEAARHPLRHVLLNIIGTGGDPVHADIDQLRLTDGDRILLCSDGLSDMVPDAAIADVLGRSLSAADACQALVDLALEAGGKDNVTVVLGHYHT